MNRSSGFHSRPVRSVFRFTVLVAVTCLSAASLTTPATEGVEAPSAPARAAGERGQVDRLLPDLTPLKAVDVYIVRSNGGRHIRFQAGLASIGAAPMEVRPFKKLRCPSGQRGASQIIYRDVDKNGKFRRSVDKKFGRHSAGCMVFHPQHNHWHFEAASRYSFYRPGHQDDVIQHARKMSFCLRDSMRVPARYGSFNAPLYYRDCSQNSPQGISRGWVDVYASYLTGQSIPIPPRVKDGVYCLAIRVDPEGHLWESDEHNNVAIRSVRITNRTQVTFAKNKLCKR